MNKTVLLPISDGIEEIETVSIIDILRRAGLSLRVSSIKEREVTAAHGTKILADSDFIDEILEDYDAIILPGGSKAAESFCEYTPLINGLKSFQKENKLIGAICASPAIVLAQNNLLDNIKATCYPSLKNYIKNYTNERVVYDKNVVTSQGPATAIDFALKIVEILTDNKKAMEVSNAILV